MKPIWTNPRQTIGTKHFLNFMKGVLLQLLRIYRSLMSYHIILSINSSICKTFKLDKSFRMCSQKSNLNCAFKGKQKFWIQCVFFNSRQSGQKCCRAKEPRAFSVLKLKCPGLQHLLTSSGGPVAHSPPPWRSWWQSCMEQLLICRRSVFEKAKAGTYHLNFIYSIQIKIFLKSKICLFVLMILHGR